MRKTLPGAYLRCSATFPKLHSYRQQVYKSYPSSQIFARIFENSQISTLDSLEEIIIFKRLCSGTKRRESLIFEEDYTLVRRDFEICWADVQGNRLMVKIGTVISYLKKIQKIYKLRDTSHLVLLTSSFFNRKLITFVLSRNTDIDCILVYNF